MTPPATTSAGKTAAARNGHQPNLSPRPARGNGATPRPVWAGAPSVRVAAPTAAPRSARSAATATRPARGAATISRPARGGATIPRRVSGPVRGASPARPARPASPARPRPVSPRQPARHPSSPRRPAAHRPLLPRLALGAAAAVRGLPDHRWLDRLVRGRAWIPVLGVLLAGIVATQVEVLKLGASMGRWVERTAALSARNQALQASDARLSDVQRIERLAARMGMVMPAPTAISFVHRPGSRGVGVALARMRPADPAQFESNLRLTTGG